MLINNTNRAHTTWSKEQLTAAKAYGEIVDMIMPGLEAEADEAEADRVAGLVVRRILRRLGREETEKNGDTESDSGDFGDAVLCQGDFTLVYRVVRLLKDAGIAVMAPTFQRVTKPTLRPDGTTVPGYSFDFVRFRSY